MFIKMHLTIISIILFSFQNIIIYPVCSLSYQAGSIKISWINSTNFTMTSSLSQNYYFSFAFSTDRRMVKKFETFKIRFLFYYILKG